MLILLTLLTFDFVEAFCSNMVKVNAKLHTRTLQTWHAKIANFTRYVYGRLTLPLNPQNKG